MTKDLMKEPTKAYTLILKIRNIENAKARAKKQNRNLSNYVDNLLEETNKKSTNKKFKK